MSQIAQWSTSESNKQRIYDFLKKTELDGIGIVQRSKYVYCFKAFLKVINKDFEEVTEQDLETFILSMANYRPGTKHKKWVGMKKFFRYIGKEQLYKNLKPLTKTQS